MAINQTDTSLPTAAVPTATTPPAAVQGLDSIKSALGNNATVDKAKQFAKDRPWATAALAGVVGMAILNTLRGR